MFHSHTESKTKQKKYKHDIIVVKGRMLGGSHWEGKGERRRAWWVNMIEVHYIYENKKQNPLKTVSKGDVREGKEE
jgi:hypothetical protein